MNQVLLIFFCGIIGLSAIACAPSANPPRATPESSSPAPQESSSPTTQVKPPQEEPSSKP